MLLYVKCNAPINEWTTVSNVPKPLNLNKLSKQDKNLIEYSIQVSWLNELMRLEKISDIEYERIKALLISKYKIVCISKTYYSY